MRREGKAREDFYNYFLTLFYFLLHRYILSAHVQARIKI